MLRSFELWALSEDDVMICYALAILASSAANPIMAVVVGIIGKERRRGVD